MNNYFLFRGVTINSIQFVNNRNDVRFIFHNCTFESGDYCGTLTCIHVLSLNMTTYFGDDEDTHFPQFIEDVFVESQTEGDNVTVTVMLAMGRYEIRIVCKKIEVVKP